MEIEPASVGGGSKSLDLEAYSSRYSGHTKYLRLNFIFDECPALQQEVLLVLAQTIQNGINTNMCVRYGDRLGSLMPPSWITQVEKSSDATAGKLGGEITSARASLSKPRIRDAHFKFGEFHHARGDLLNALKQFMLARDHSSDASEMVESAIKVIVVSVDLNNLSVAENSLHKAEQAMHDSQMLTRRSAQLRAAKGLLSLKKGDFEYAARYFAQVSPYFGDSITNLMCAEDIGMYGTICAIASLERDEVKSILVDGSSTFKNFVELDPSVVDLATLFVDGDYGKVMSWLSVNEACLRLDIHLSEHVDKLFQAIRERCILQYVSPYLSFSLQSMSEAFFMDVASLESCVAVLISSGRLNARIDSAEKTVYVVSTERRTESFSQVAKLSGTYLREVQGLLLRMSCLEKDVVVPGADALDDLGLRQHSNMDHEDFEGD